MLEGTGTGLRAANKVGPTADLAKYVVELEYENLPKEVVNQAKICVLDFLGVALFGSTRPWGKMVTDVVKELGGIKESTVIGTGYKTTAVNAALANGTMGHGFELDDVHNEALLHPGTVVIPSAIAVGEKVHATGKDFITAVVAGYDVCSRIGSAVEVESSHMLRGFHPTGTNGPFGSAAAAGKLLRLSEEQIINALGIAGSQASGLMEFYKEGAMVKRFHAGKAAESGIISALLAQKGFTGPSTVLEGIYGYCKVYSDKYNIGRITENLGKKFEIMKISFKPYSCCRSLHSAVDATIDLVKTHKIAKEDVKEIIVGTNKKVVDQNVIYEPMATMAAQYSLPYCVAAVLLYGKVGPTEFEDEKLKDPEILSFAKKVKAVVNPELERAYPWIHGNEVTIHMRDGRKYSKLVHHPKGDPENPMNAQEFENKFRSLASSVLTDGQIGKIIGAVRELEKLGDVANLANLLAR